MYYLLRLNYLELYLLNIQYYIYHSNFYAKQLYRLDRTFQRTPLHLINILESVVNYSSNYSKFRNVLYPTLTKILVCWLVERCHMVTEYISCSTGIVLSNKTSIIGLGGLNFLNDSSHTVYFVSHHF